MKTFYKDPDAVLDYKFDWSAWLADASPDDTISTSAITVDSGITLDSQPNDTTSAIAWLSGGTPGETYLVTHEIASAGGRTANRSILIKVTER